jgi:hypothetical protein
MYQPWFAVYITLNHMNPEPAILNFQAAILAVATERLGRSLTEVEQSFVTQRQGFVALEAVQDRVLSLAGVALERYLRSESPNVA